MVNLYGARVFLALWSLDLLAVHLVLATDAIILCPRTLPHRIQLEKALTQHDSPQGCHVPSDGVLLQSS